jgi:transcriptional regulator with XRE-family HTH domain
VAANLRRIRRDHELTTAMLSRRLSEIGHPIADTGITKIEKGQRRVDVDDLVALAVALGVTPNTLLLPEVDVPAAWDRRHEVTGGAAQARAEEIWAWALGERPLGKPAVSEASDAEAQEAEGRFVAQNRRHHALGIGSWIIASGRGATAGASDHDYDAAMVAATVMQAFQWGRLNTADIRQATESGFLAALLVDRDEADAVMEQAWNWLREVYEERLKEEPDESS